MSITSTIIHLFQEIRKSSLFKTSSVYTISNILNASIPFVLLPILTKHLSQADFGVVFMFTTTASFIMPFVSINMEGAIARKFYSNDSNFNQYVGNCILISLFSLLTVLSIGILFIEILSSLTGISPQWILIAVFYCFSQFLILILLTIYQVKVRPFHYGSTQIFQSLINLGFSILLVVLLNMNWEGRLIGIVFSSFLFSIFAFIILWRQTTFKPNLPYIKHALKFGGGLIPHALGASLIIMTNRFFLLNMVNIEETGLYGVASQVASVVAILTVSFNNAFVPWLYKKLNENNYETKEKIVKMTYFYFLAILTGGILFAILTPLFFKLFIAANFVESLKYSFWIILGFVFQGMYFMVTNYISYAEKTHYQAMITLTVGLINIPANYILINLFGALGAGVAFCFSFFFLFIFTWLISKKVFPMPWTLNFIFLNHNENR